MMSAEEIHEMNRLKSIVRGMDRRIAEQELQIVRMQCVLALLRDWAQNDINIRTGKGQHVGTPKFSSLPIAKEVKSMSEGTTHDAYSQNESQ